MAPSDLRLLLLRHGIAEERSAGRPDGLRPLTPAGRRRTTAVLERAMALGLKAERLVSSPLVRARQSAEIALSLGLAPGLELATALEPEADPLPLLARWLADHAVPPTAAAWARSGPDQPPRAMLQGSQGKGPAAWPWWAMNPIWGTWPPGCWGLPWARSRSARPDSPCSFCPVPPWARWRIVRRPVPGAWSCCSPPGFCWLDRGSKWTSALRRPGDPDA